MPADQQQFERIVLQRLRELERRHARLRWLLVILLVAVGWRELAYHPVIRADRFELLDTSGRVRVAPPPPSKCSGGPSRVPGPASRLTRGFPG